MVRRVGDQDVSRETYDDLMHFADLVKKWTTKINLVSPATIDRLWDRHIVDSAQIFGLARENYEKWADIGSGGGFPGIVVAILAKEKTPTAAFTLIESDQRKATFLRTAVRELDLNASIIADRIENADQQKADIVSARALTSLSGMMPFLDRHLSLGGCAVLHKGRQYQKEVAEARQSWSFALEEHVSLTDPDARLLEIKGITRVG